MIKQEMLLEMINLKQQIKWIQNIIVILINHY